MSRIFLSHSSIDEIEAVALKHWLADNGWDDKDVFFILDKRSLATDEHGFTRINNWLPQFFVTPFG